VQNKLCVLFVSDGNSARSQMAEGILRKLAGNKFEVFSAGFDPKPLDPMAVMVMNEIGIDISHQQSKHVNDYLEKQFDYSINFCGHDRYFCLDFQHDHAALQWTCDDPALAIGSHAEKLEAFRNTREQIQQLIENWLPEVKGRAESSN